MGRYHFLLLFIILMSMVLLPVTQASQLNTSRANGIFSKNQLSVGYYHRDFIFIDCPVPPSPIFWEATTKVDQGTVLMYQRLLYHNQKRFSLYFGTDISRWGLHSDTLHASSLFVALRYWFFRSAHLDGYLSYSIAGPTWMSQRFIGHVDLGSRFIFQDYIGLGLRMGGQRAIHLAVRLVHYSNAGIFRKNPGFSVPIMLYLGYSF